MEHGPLAKSAPHTRPSRLDLWLWGILLTQDPIGLAGGVNLYAYAGNNPVAFSDPYGLCPQVPHLCVVAAVAVFKIASAAARSPTGQRVVQRGSELARNLAQSGAVRQAGEAAHHIVAQTAKAAQPARDKLAEVGIKINDAVNGVILPATREYVGQAVNHLIVHTQKYYNAVNEALANVQVKEEAVAALKAIGEALKDGSFTP